MKVLQIIAGFFTTFVIITGGAGCAILYAGYKLNHDAIVACCGLGAIAACKELRSMLSLPPLSNGNYNAIAQFMKETNQKRDDEGTKPPFKLGQ